MTKHLLFAAVFLTLLPLQSASQEANLRVPPELNYIESITTSGIAFQRFDRQPDSAVVDLPNVLIDVSLARNHNFPVFHNQPTEEFLLEYLISKGLADLVDPAEATPELLEIYLRTPRARIAFPELFPDEDDAAGQPEPEQAITDPPFWTFDRVLAVSGVLLTILLSTLVVTAAVRAIRKFLYDRHATIVFVGLPASGKTSLFIRFCEPDASEQKIETLQSTFGKDEKGATSINHGRLKFIPKLIDIAGSQSELVIDQISSIVPGRKKKYAVVFVLSATEGLAQGEPDKEYLARQLGALQFAAPAILRAKSLGRPDAVAVFINKLDLAFAGSPGPDQKTKHKSMFQEHVAIVRDAAKQRSVPVIEIVGSAMKGWGTDRFLQELTNAMEG